MDDITDKNTTAFGGWLCHQPAPSRPPSALYWDL